MASERVQRQIDRLLDEAEEAAARQEWETVRARAQHVLTFDPENQDGIAFLAAAGRALAAGASSPTQHAAPPPAAPAGYSAPDHPTSFANGRYQVKSFLGEGGKKRVYLAHDTTLDREVAFALIKAEGLDDTSRTRIQREAQAMGRLGSHPHIVTVFDLGQEGNQPFMVTELMAGGDVEGLIEGATDHRLPLEQAVKIAQETCRGLEFAHGRGIVHRDLKPGNVWLAESGTAKIGDFGLAVALDRSRLTTEGMMVGTVAYMPPEQAMGGEVTPQSDLYSLGAMLYEMVTGRPPFLGDDAVAIIGQHINTPPVAPTWHNPVCPRSLDALILRLLAKDPAERPGSATDVLSALEGIDTSEVGAVREPSRQDDLQALDSLAGGVFVGRQREMGDLKAALEDALSGRGRLVMLVGEPGIGKTRIAQELATYAGLRKAQVLWGRCYEGEGAPPYWPWVQAIRSYVRDQDAELLRSEMGAGAADIAQIVSDVKEQLPGLETPPELEPEQARFRLFDSITAFLRSVGRRQPLVLVLDDLHWADRPSLLLLEFVARELSNARLLIIGTYRDVDVSRRHPLAITLGELTRERLFQRVLLRGLDQEDVGRFIELVSGVSPPRGMVEAVHRQTEGNPLFVTEVVRLLVQEGEVGASRPAGAEPLRDSDTWTVRIPEGVREVIGRRLDRLSDRCNETLTMASVIGREFTLEQLVPLIEDLTRDHLLEVLDEALASKVIEELPRAVGRYQFTHALIQETLAEELSSTRKVQIHARIAQALEEMYGEQADSYSAELAHHFGEAQTVLGAQKLIHYSLLAGQHALDGFAFEEAVAHFERGLTAKGLADSGMEPAADEEGAALLFGLGRARVATLPVYELEGAVSILRRAFRYYAQAGDLEQAVAVAAQPLPPAAGSRTGMAQLISDALKLVPASSLEAGRLLSIQGRVLSQEEGEYESSRGAFDQALAIAQREGDEALELRILADSAEARGYQNLFEESLDRAQTAIELTARVDDPRSEMLAHYWAALITFGSGQAEQGGLHARASLAAAQRLRHHFYLARSLWAHEVIFHSRGLWQEARQSNDEGLAASPREPRQLFSRAIVEYQTGNFSQGATYLQRLLEITQTTPPGPTLDRCLLALSSAEVARIAGTTEGLEVARQAAETLISYPSANPLLSLFSRAGLAWMAVGLGDSSAAAELYPYM
ncbi:MAG: protein kinase [Chloroflexi bacterium]|nr:protein kinase [Chloroflexota bacterium]